jgi:hypothetical protein
MDEESGKKQERDLHIRQGLRYIAFLRKMRYDYKWSF